MLRKLLALRFRKFKPGAQPDRTVRVAGLRLRVQRSVFDPRLHFTSTYLATLLGRPGTIERHSSVMDLGTGTGIAAIAAARAGAGRVVATDVNPAAVRSCEYNVAAHGLSNKVKARLGDMFQPVEGDRFDVIISNPPYLRGHYSNIAEQAYMGGANLEWFDRFLLGAHHHLTPTGKVLMVLGDAAEINAILSRFREAGWEANIVGRRDLLVEVLYIYELRPPTEGDEAER